ncbi:MAG: hypothetical protein AMXMBFR56_63880 [Polyangiaceae bacterium]
MARRYALYWCTTDDGDEDWFVVVPSARAARSFHERAEGYDIGSASAERIVALPANLIDGDGWRDPETGERSNRSAWPSDGLLEACGGEVAHLERDELRARVGIVCTLVRFGGRVFRAGDLVENHERRVGKERRPRLGVFRGGG